MKPAIVIVMEGPGDDTRVIMALKNDNLVGLTEYFNNKKTIQNPNRVQVDISFRLESCS